MRTLIKILVFLVVFSFAIALTATCDVQPGVSNANIAKANSNSSNIAANTNAGTVNSNSGSSVTVSEAAEPAEYQANVALRVEALGGDKKSAVPTVSTKVARKGDDRRMEFTMPAGGRVVYLEKAGTTYLILPELKQYAELNKDSTGFDVRRMLTPEQIVQQVKSVPGVERVGEEQYNGRDVIKYRYGSVAETGSQAGQVATDSFLYVDKATGLPLHSETVSQSKSGGNVQGYSGLRVITEISDISTTAEPDLFAEPTGFQKVESEQLRAQVNMIFTPLGTMLAQMMNQSQTATSPEPAR